MAVKIRGALRGAAVPKIRGAAKGMAGGGGGTPEAQPSTDGRVMLWCPGVALVRLPWWPESVSRTGLTRNWSQQERDGRTPLLVDMGPKLDELSVGGTVRWAVFGASVGDWLGRLYAIASATKPVTLVMGDDVRGLFQVTDLTVDEIDHAADGTPATAGVQFTLTRASTATVNVGIVPRKRQRKARKKSAKSSPKTDSETERDDAPRNKKSPAYAQWYAKSRLSKHGWGDDQFPPLRNLWDRESGWQWNATNPSSGAYGIPQALPGSKMAAAGHDWRTNPETQVRWGLSYIKGRYGTPTKAWAHFQARNWY